MASAILAVSCKFTDAYFVDFSKVNGTDPSWFNPTSQTKTDLGEGLPDDCYLPGGEKANEYVDEDTATKSTSSSAANIIQQLLDYSNGRKLIQIAGTYPSTDNKGKPITVSGKVILPADGVVKRLILVSHYTIGCNKECPSNCFSLEGVLAPMGYGLIIPDYIGYGVTASQIHPYLVMDLTAKNVVDMYLAVLPWLKAAGVQIQNDDIYLMGYSQGGAATMSVMRRIESEYADQIRIRRVFAGGGPYDITATYDQFITTNHAAYPCAVPLVVQGMQVGANLDLSMKEFATPLVYEHLDEWFNSKIYTTGQMNALLGTKVTSDLISEAGRDRTSKQVAQLYKAMNANSIARATDWAPKAPVYMMHSMDDETVNYINAQIARNTWSYSNITYNFGHYGKHVSTCLRFIFTVKTILKEED